MKHLILSFLALSLSFSSYALSPNFRHEAQTNNPSPLRLALERLIESWQDPSQRQDYEEMGTWVPEIGIRGKYAANKHLLSVLILGGLIGEPVYLQGGHSSDLNLQGNDFGFYNPKFLSKLEKELKTIFKDPTFIQKAQPIYDKYLKSYLRAFKAADTHLSNKKIKTEALAAYRAALNSPETSLTMQEHFRVYSDRLAGIENLDWYEANTTALFWIRREMDGTSRQFQKLLNLILKHFDPK